MTSVWSISGPTASRPPKAVSPCRSATPSTNVSVLLDRHLQLALARPGARRPRRRLLRKAEDDSGRRNLYFPQTMRDATPHRRILPRSLGRAVPNPWTGWGCRWRTSSRSARTSTIRPRSSACSTPRSRSSSWSSSRTRPTPSSTTTTCSTRTTKGDRTEDQDAKNPGVNARYANLVHNDLNDNSGRVRCRELLTREPAELRPPAALYGGRGRREDVAAVHVDQSCQADGDGGPVPLRALRLALLRRPALHHQLPRLRRPRRRNHPLHLPAGPRVVLVSRNRRRPKSRC